MDYSVALLDALLDRVGSPVCLVSPDDHVLRTNQRWTDLFGSLPSGAAVSELFPGAERLNAAVSVVRSGGHVQHVRLDGAAAGEATVSSVPMDGGTGALISVEPSPQAARHDDAKERLVRMVAHDLRGPITVVMTQAQLLRRKPDRADLVTSRAEMISRNCQRLDQAIGDLVDVIGLESGRFELGAGRVDVVALLRDVLARASTIDVSRVTAVLPDEPLMVDGDGPRLERLMTNALEYVVRGTSGSVQSTARQENGFVQVIIRPTPVEGSPAAGPVAPVSPVSRPYEPLNLFVARLLAEDHGGSLRLESDGQEELVRVSLPIDRPAAHAKKAT